MSTSGKNNSFWTSCPRKLEYYPQVTCPLGKNNLSENPSIPKCHWFVNSEPDHYCFWTWLRRNSNHYGAFSPMMQHEISELLLIPSAKVQLELKNALENLKNTNEFKKLREIL